MRTSVGAVRDRPAGGRLHRPLPDWQQEICRQVRDLAHAADPAITETIKRTVQPYFVSPLPASGREVRRLSTDRQRVRPAGHQGPRQRVPLRRRPHPRPGRSDHRRSGQPDRPDDQHLPRRADQRARAHRDVAAHRRDQWLAAGERSSRQTSPSADAQPTGQDSDCSSRPDSIATNAAGSASSPPSASSAIPYSRCAVSVSPGSSGAASWAAFNPTTSGCDGLSSRIRLVRGGSWPIARNIFSSVGLMSPGSPTRQAADVVSRWDSRTCFTSSTSVVVSQETRSSSPLRVSSSTSSPPRSTSPRAMELSCLPSKAGMTSTHSSSTGSVSSSTS